MSDIPDVLKDAQVNSLFDEHTNYWDNDVLRDIYNERDCELIQQIPIPVHGSQDSWYWCFDDKGQFTVKNCYRRLRGEMVCPDILFWKKLWGINLPGKVLNLLWRVCCQVLPTADALHKKCVNLELMCSWCHGDVEDDMHILFQCCFAKEVWKRVRL